MFTLARSRCMLLVVPLLIAVGITGCGEAPPKRIAITGTVKLNGQPVEHGSISFIPVADAPNLPAGGEIKAGEYTLTADAGPSSGKYRVEIRWSKPTGKKVAMGSPAPPGTMVDEVKEAIPAKYNTQSTLEREITGDESTVDFDLDS